MDQNAYAVLRALQYLKSVELNAMEDQESKHHIKTSDLKKIITAIMGGNEESHANLARWIYDELEFRDKSSSSDTSRLITVMVQSGKVKEAMDLALGTQRGQGVEVATWARILRAYGELAKNEGRFEKFYEEMVAKRPSAAKSPEVAQEVLRYYAGVLKDLGKTKEKVKEYKEKEVVLTIKALIECIRVAVAGGDLVWGKDLVAEVMKNEAGMTREAWDFILQSSVDLGRGVEEIDAYLDEMQKKAETTGGPAPNIDTINGIVDHFVELNNPFFAERFIALSQTKWKFESNQATLTAKIRYRLQAGDNQGAIAAYNELKSRYQVTKDESGSESLRLLRTLCEKDYDPKTIETIFEDVKDFKIPLDPQTLSTLTMHYIRLDNLEEAIEVLRVNSARLSLSQRSDLSSTLTSHITSKDVPVETGWAIYNAVFQLFPELSKSKRIRIMDRFFSEGQSGMGFLVFDHLHNSPIVGPADATAFNRVLQGIAKIGDDVNLKKVYTYFKLSPIELNTTLLNSLMAAFTNSSEPEVAVQLLYNKRKTVKGGPDSETYLIALQAAVRMQAGGVVEAYRIFRDMLTKHRPDMERLTVSKEHLLALIAAMSRDAVHSDKLWAFVRNCRRGKDNPHMPTMDPEIMRATWDAMPYGQPRFDVQYWAERWYPNVWAEVEAGIKKDYEDGKFDTEEEIAARKKKQSKLTGAFDQVEELFGAPENSGKSKRLETIDLEEQAKNGPRIQIWEGRRKRVPSNQSRGV